MKTLNYKSQSLTKARIIAAGFVAIVLVPTATAFARVGDELPYGSVQIADLGVDEPAILASNPFYGFTNLMRDMKDSFVSDRLSKASTRLEVMSMKAAQLLKTRSIAPNNVKLISKALNEYQFAVYQYALAAGRLTSADFSEEGGEEIAAGFVHTNLTHLRFIDDILASDLPLAEQAILTEMFERLTSSTLRLFADVLGLTTIAMNLEEGAEDPLGRIRICEMLASLAKHAAFLERNDEAQQLLALRANILTATAQLLAASTISAQEESLAMSSAAALPMAMSAAKQAPAPETRLTEEQLAAFSSLAGGLTERIQTISYLLSTPELAADAGLTAVRNQALIRVFSR